MKYDWVKMDERGHFQVWDYKNHSILFDETLKEFTEVMKKVVSYVEQ